MIYLPLIGVILFIILWYVLKHSAKTLQSETNMPAGEIVYKGINTNEAQMLSAPRYFIRGYPDYIVKQSGNYIPVEIKSATPPKKLYDSVRMQLIAHALLVEATYNKLPEYGLVQYLGKTFKVKVRNKDIQKLETAVKTMREAKLTGRLAKVYKSWFYCPVCPLQDCTERSR